jgi:hypothetical protein
MTTLLPDISDFARDQLDAVRFVMIDDLMAKKYREIFRDLFRILNADFEEEGDEFEIVAIEYHCSGR